MLQQGRTSQDLLRNPCHFCCKAQMAISHSLCSRDKRACPAGCNLWCLFPTGATKEQTWRPHARGPALTRGFTGLSGELFQPMPGTIGSKSVTQCETHNWEPKILVLLRT